MNNNRGVTLVELLVVSGIIGILAVALGISFQGWIGGYKVESEINTLYSNMRAAQQRAVQLNQYIFMDISPDGRFYRISQDDSDANTTPKPKNGNGIFEPQAAWTTIQSSNPLNWGTSANTTDTTITNLSKKTGLMTSTGSFVGLFSARNAAPFNGANNFVLGFDKRGMINDMIGVTDIQQAVDFPATWGLSICIFSDSDPNYDCINIRPSKITLGKLTKQNTAGGTCDASNCISK
jgi:prepilin-type N-terminal cleavage/methylation domain-containing protein